MLISNQLSQLPLQLSKPDLQKLLQNLQPGQLLKATVVQRVTADSVQLKIGAQELLAYTRLRLAAGQKLTMRVTKGGEIPELRLLQERTGSELQSQILRQALPRQIPQASLFNTLQTIARTPPELLQKLLAGLLRKSSPDQGAAGRTQSPPAGSLPLQKALGEAFQKQPAEPLQGDITGPPAASKALLPTDLQKAIQAILAKALPQAGNLSAPQIRQALLNSGLFLEANLAFGNPLQAAGDLKANLLNLSLLLRAYLQSGQRLQQANRPSQPQGPKAVGSGNSALPQLLGELLRQAEGGLARIQTHQLTSLPTEESSTQSWRFELPVQQAERIDSFLIRLEQEREGRRGQAGTTWKITLNFDFSPLGPVEARLSLRGEEISAFFLAEQADSAALLSRNLTRLGDAFARVNLKVGQLHSQQGKISPPSSTLPSATPFLLDEKA